MVLAGPCWGPTKHSTNVALNIHHWCSQKQTAKFLKFNHFTSKASDFFSIQNTVFLCLLYLNSVFFYCSAISFPQPLLLSEVAAHLFSQPGLYFSSPLTIFSATSSGSILSFLNLSKLVARLCHSIPFGWFKLPATHPERSGNMCLHPGVPKSSGTGHELGGVPQLVRPITASQKGFKPVRLCSERKAHWPLSG